jgi:hypothetical protein
MSDQDVVNFIAPPITPGADEMGKRSVEQGVRPSFTFRAIKPVAVEKV